MPNRIIKESISTSDKIASLSDFEFRLWVGLITYVDDAGRGDARPAIIKGRVFPLRDRVTTKDIDAGIHSLAAKGCISLYTVGGKSYFWFPTWTEHQRIRDSKPKYPAPEEADASPQVAASRGEPPQAAASRGLNPNPNPNPKENPNPNPKDCEEDRPPAPAPSAPKKKFIPPTLEEVAAYVRERGSNVDPQGFIDFYASKGWLVGKTPMKDWKAACRNAEKWERWGNAPPGATANRAQNKPDAAELERLKRLREKIQGE